MNQGGWDEPTSPLASNDGSDGMCGRGRVSLPLSGRGWSQRAGLRVRV